MIKSMKVRLAGMPEIPFHKRVLDTVDHTLQTLSAAYWLFHDREAFNNAFGTRLIEDDIGDCKFDDCARLMFIHDLHKLVENPGHAEKGASFLDNIVIGLVRHHDKFGVIHTGEASFPFLNQITDWVSSLMPEKRDLALSMLQSITIIDAASLGFLNEARVETYRRIRSVITDAVKGKQSLDQMALEDTPDRIRRLIESNNRNSIQLPLMHKVLSQFAQRDDLTLGLSRVRFDAGVYVLEPLLRFIIDPSNYLMKSVEKLNLTEAHLPMLVRFLGCIYKLVSMHTVPKSELVMVDLTPYSIKNDRNVEAFESWAKSLMC